MVLFNEMVSAYLLKFELELYNNWPCESSSSMKMSIQDMALILYWMPHSRESQLRWIFLLSGLPLAFRTRNTLATGDKMPCIPCDGIIVSEVGSWVHTLFYGRQKMLLSQALSSKMCLFVCRKPNRKSYSTGSSVSFQILFDFIFFLCVTKKTG